MQSKSCVYTMHIKARGKARAEETSTYTWLSFRTVKIPTNDKQIPAVPHEVRLGVELSSQKWETCHPIL